MTGVAIIMEAWMPDGTPSSSSNSTDMSKGHDHRFFVQLTCDVVAD